MANSFEFIQQRPTIQNALDQAHGLGVDNIAFDTFVDVGDRATIWRTLFSDGILTFESDYACPFKHIAATIEPVQDLHGQDAPYPPGGGKNMIPYPYVSTTKTVFGITYTDMGDGTLKINGTATGSAFFDLSSVMGGMIYPSAGEYTMKGSGQSGVNMTIVVNGSYKGAASTNPTTVNIKDGDAVNFYAQVTSGTVVNNLIVYPQFEAGESSSSWSPYSNECPISGWTGMTISHSGADMSDPETLSINWQDSAGTVYGGTLAIDEDGECVLTVTHNYYNLKGSTASRIFSYDYNGKHGVYFQYAYGIIANRDSGVCNMAHVSTEPDYSAPQYMWFGVNSNHIFWIGILDVLNMTLDEFKTWIQSNDVYITRRLATPIVYTLPDVTMLTSLLGTNNIWASTGGIAVTYKDFNPLFLTDPLNVGVMTLK